MQVSLRRCECYDPVLVREKLEELLTPLGGLSAFVRPGMQVLIKPNMLGAAKPETAVTTHPVLVQTVVRMVKEIGAFPVLGDSPGFHTTEDAVRRIYHACGFESVALEEDIPLLCQEGHDWVDVAEPYVLQRIPMAKGMKDADVVINMPKMKTHGLTGFTGAVKNLYGVMAGLTKAQHHAIFPKSDDFADMLLDIEKTVHPVLHIMDGILGMEGAGPSAGVPHWAHLLAASADPYALDAVCVELMGLPLHSMVTVQRSITRGKLLPHLESIDFVGDALEDCRPDRPFIPAVKSGNFITGYLGKMGQKCVPKAVQKLFCNRPLFDFSICKGCGDCRKTCPPGAITMGEDHKPNVDYSKCISCFCCQEMCHFKAITIGHRPLFRRK